MRRAALLICLCVPTLSLAQGGGGGGGFAATLGAIGMGGGPPSITYGGVGTFSGQPADTHRLNVSMPLHKGEKNSYSASLAASTLHFGERLTLADSGIVAPTDLHRVDIGGNYSRKLEGERNFGMRFAVGSASDHPFFSEREMTFSLSAHYSYPSSEVSQWMWTIFFSNNNPIADYFPIPGFAYIYRGKEVSGIFGIPFTTFQWTPMEPWSISLGVFGPTVNSEITYGKREEIQIFTGFAWIQQTFLRRERVEDKDRLYANEMRTFVGARSPVSKHLSAELQAGHAFNRVLYEGPRFGKRERGSVDLDDSWFAQWNLRYIF